MFEYELRIDKLLGSLIRREDVAGNGLFSLAFGYHESRIAGESDLTAFAAKVREIVHAEQPDPSEPIFVLGGRKLIGQIPRGLSVEQVAVIVRAEREIHQKWGALQSHWRQEVASFQKLWSTRVDEYQRRWERVETCQADYPSSRRWVGTGRIGYHRRDGVARAGRVVPATPGRSHRRIRMSDTTRRPVPPRA